MRNILKLSFKEERANVVSHGIMAVFMLLSLPVSSVKGYLKGGVLLSFSYSVFVISLFLMFLTSTLYHSMSYNSKHKYIFRKLDHIFIFVAIAGTYTPITLFVIGGKLGFILTFIQWLMVLFGILYKSLANNSMPWLSLSVYLGMGWMALFILPKLLLQTNIIFLSLIVLGGLLYSVGTYFYTQQHKPYHHFIWHVFINLASISHFVAIIFFIN